MFGVEDAACRYACVTRANGGRDEVWELSALLWIDVIRI